MQGVTEMLSLVLNAVASVMVAAIAVHAVILHVRLGRLRKALSEMGSVLPAFDASVNRIAAMADGFTVKVGAELEGIETRLQAARRLSVELASASREAEEAAAQLRQTKRPEPARASALPRELVEPKGFAERAGLPPVQRAAPSVQAADRLWSAAADTASPQTEGGEREMAVPVWGPMPDEEARQALELDHGLALANDAGRAPAIAPLRDAQGVAA
jgi:hypothetical protein